MPLVDDRCICVRKVEYSETSQILGLFGRTHGLLRVIAKGAHRRTKAGASKFDGGLDLLEVGKAVFSFETARELNTLTEWSLLNGQRELRKNLRGIYLGQYAAELTSLLIEEHDPHPELFDRLEGTLSQLGTPMAEEVFLAFELDMLQQTGYLPELQNCVECSQPLEERAYFSALRGGVVCRNCQPLRPDATEINVRLLRLVQQMLTLPKSNGSTQRLPKLTRHQTDPLNRMFAEHVEHTLGRRMRMPRYVL